MNPDPTSGLSGQRTTDEMSHAWIAMTHLDESGYEKLLAEREERDRRSLADPTTTTVTLTLRIKLAPSAPG